MNKVHWGKLAVSVIGAELIGNLGSLVTFPQISSWYAYLEKPGFNPPNWLFGPVWTLLYALMGVAFYLVWMKGVEKANVRRALVAFGIQLALNVAWSFIFFGAHWLGVAFIEIVLMWIAILVTILLFAKISKPAAWLLVPYLGWVSFASVLNFAVWWLNR